jgi:hypothetical protein
MHKDPPPGLFDRRRPLGHVATHGVIVGFIIAVVAQFGWSLIRQSSGSANDSTVATKPIAETIDPKTTRKDE